MLSVYLEATVYMLKPFSWIAALSGVGFAVNSDKFLVPPFGNMPFLRLNACDLAGLRDKEADLNAFCVYLLG